jgi:hypothetical protein
VSGSSFYDAGPLKQIAVNLFYGWGYNFYRQENQLRTDDLLVRSKVGWLLGLARASVETAEADYRREFIPPPSRAHPFPPADVVKNAQALEKLANEIGGLAAQIHSSITTISWWGSPSYCDLCWMAVMVFGLLII